MSALNRRHTLPALRTALAGLDADLVLLQEVQGRHDRRARQHPDWPDGSQHDYLGATLPHRVYGRNADYRQGHHGNALLSRYPIRAWDNVDLTLHRFEQRGLLHAEIEVPDWTTPLHALCVHLNLRASDRRRQLAALITHVRCCVPDEAPLIIAGDFNDWQREACRMLRETLDVRDAHLSLHGRLAASFPARFPVLALDRIYLRGLSVHTAEVHRDAPWSQLSDHAPLTATVRPA
jgi:endonuclease/exonuclease/phosphatase family metal-dependent hydrolase